MKIRIIFIWAALLLLVSSCKDDEPKTLTLHTPQQVDNVITLNWEQANISGFQYYMVMRSSDQQHYDVINDIATPTSDAFRKEITSFDDRTYPLGIDTLYYKIMAVGNETLSSKNVCYPIENPVKFLKEQVRDMYYVKESNKFSVLLYDNPSYQIKLKTFDLKTGQFSSNEATIDLSSSGCWYFWGEYNGKTEFYNYDSDWTMYVYNASTLQQVASLQTPIYVWYDPSISNNKGIVYIYSGYYLYLISRTTGTLTQYQPTSYFDANRLYYNSKDNKLYVVDYYSSHIRTFNLDNSGNVTGEETYTIGNDYSSQLLYIENSSLFIVSTNSGVKILDMNTKTLYNTDLTQIPNLALLNNNVLYVSSNGNSIYQLSVGDFKLIKTIPVRVTPLKFMTDNEYLYFFGQYDYNNFIIDKIKL